MSKVGCVVQARMGSTRLPGKSMLPLAGEPLIYRVLQRLVRISLFDEIILATSIKSENESLIHQANRLGVRTVVGSEDNVAERFVTSINTFGLDVVVRIPADNYLTEHWAIELLLKKHNEYNHGFTTNIMQIQNSGYPDGVGGEAFEASEFLALHSPNCSQEVDEHVHKHFYSYSSTDDFLIRENKVRTCYCPKEYAKPQLRFDINTVEEYRLASRIYADLCDSEGLFGLEEVLGWMEKQNSDNFC